jgi:hypothetical protein
MSAKERKAYKLTHPAPWLDIAAVDKAEREEYKLANRIGESRLAESRLGFDLSKQVPSELPAPTSATTTIG